MNHEDHWDNTAAGLLKPFKSIVKEFSRHPLYRPTQVSRATEELMARAARLREYDVINDTAPHGVYRFFFTLNAACTAVDKFTYVVFIPDATHREIDFQLSAFTRKDLDVVREEIDHKINEGR